MRVLFALPDCDFDPTEAGVTWRILTEAGHAAAFATPSGNAASADPAMVTGQGLDVWGRIPVLRDVPLVGLVLRANRDAREAYAAMVRDVHFATPARYEDLRVAEFDALVLPGGHYARGMRTYLESPVLRAFVANFFEEGKPVGAICHGALLAARSESRSTGRSVLYGKKTTALTWGLPRRPERRSRLSDQDRRPASRHAHRFTPLLRRPRRHVRLRPLARRRPHLRQNADRSIRRPLTPARQPASFHNCRESCRGGWGMVGRRGVAMAREPGRRERGSTERPERTDARHERPRRRTVRHPPNHRPNMRRREKQRACRFEGTPFAWHVGYPVMQGTVPGLGRGLTR